MSFLAQVIIIFGCAAVASIYLLIQCIRKRGSKEGTVFAFTIAELVALFIIDIGSLNNIFDNTSAPFSSWFPLCASIVLLCVLAIVSNHDYKKQCSEFSKSSISFFIPAIAVVIILALFFGVGHKEEQDTYSDGYNEGYDDGYNEANRNNEDDWRYFFASAQLHNTVTGEPINSLDDFRKWEIDFANYKAERNKK